MLNFKSVYLLKGAEITFRRVCYWHGGFMNFVKVGFIGVGGIGGAHLDRISKIPKAKIVAVCDVVPERVKERAAAYRANPYTDYREMISKESLDAVWVCVPPFAHGDEVPLCAERGIHVFIEKPVALTMEVARRMQTSAEKAGIKTWVGYHFRQLLAVKRVKELLEKEGGLIGMAVGYWWGGVAGGPDFWWRRKELSGGQVIEQTTHIFDLARFLVGDVEKVYAELDTILNKDEPNFTIEDVSVVTLRFRNKAVGVITGTSGAKPGGGYVGLKVLAKRIQVEVTGSTARVFKGQESMEVRSTNDPYYDEDLKFIEAILEDKPTEVPISEGVKSLEISLAAVESSGKGKVITLPLP